MAASFCQIKNITAQSFFLSALTINRMLASTVFKKTKGTGFAYNKALKTTPFGRSDAITRGGFAIMPHATAPLSLMLSAKWTVMNPVSFLEKLREQYIATEDDDLLFTNKECALGSTIYRLNCWKDFHGKDSVVVFELKEKGWLVSTSTCLGIRYSETQDILLLSEQQLWDIGIP